MLIDIHIHTTRYSECSSLHPVDMAVAAKEAGLDGICLTEHQKVWSPEDLETMSKAYAIQVFSGVEVTTTEGDILAYGLRESVSQILTPKELRALADESGAALVAAHPFRGFLLFGFQTLSLSVEEAAERPIFKYVDAIEGCNCKVTDSENDFARQVAEYLKLPVVGGSDAHEVREVGICATQFDESVKGQADFMEAIKSGAVSCVRMK